MAEELREKIYKAFMKENCSAEECDESCVEVCTDYLDGVGCTLAYHFADEILALIAAAGYRKVPPGEPPVLMTENIKTAWKTWHEQEPKPYLKTFDEWLCQAQRDADMRWVKGLK